MESTNDLKRCVKQYRDIDNELRQLNKQVYERRESRRMVEIEMMDLVKLPEFSNLDKLRIGDDESIIKIDKPGTWNKAWTLSKKDLKEHLTTFMAQSTGPSDVDQIFNWIVSEQAKKLVSTEYSFTRVIKE